MNAYHLFASVLVFLNRKLQLRGLEPFKIAVCLFLAVGSGCTRPVAPQPTPPQLAMVIPSYGPNTGGFTISLRGADFASGPGLSVTLGGVPASEVRFVSPNEIMARAPAQPGVAGPVDVTVTNPGGRAVSSRLLTYYPVNFDLADAPSVSAGVGPVHSLGAADFNGDGQLDLAVINGYAGLSTGSFGVLLGRGGGVFDPAVSVASLGLDPEDLAVGDFNNDGQADVAVFDLFTGPIDLFLGLGGGRFGSPLKVTTPSREPLAVGDFNRDGKLDLVSGGVDVLLGQGDGRFAPAVSYPVSEARQIAVADLNGDGRLDLAVATGRTRTIDVLLGGGDGSFAAPVSYPVQVPSGNFTETVAVAVGDLNRDGRPDVIAGTQTEYPMCCAEVSVFPAGAGGGFLGPVKYPLLPSPVNDVSVGDFDRDGKLDVAVAASSLYILRGTGDGGFQPALDAYAVGANPHRLVTSDLNGDGQLDLAIAADDRVVPLLGQDGRFPAPVALPSSRSGIAGGDLNGDGRADLVSIKDDRVLIGLRDSRGGFQEQAYDVGSPGNYLRNLVLLDLDGDGHLDITVLDAVVGVITLFGDGSGRYGEPNVARQSVAYSSSSNGPRILVGDTNRDGHPELIVNEGDYSAAAVTVLSMTARRFARAGTYALGTVAGAAGDFNGDGLVDLLAGGLRLGRAEGGFEAPKQGTEGLPSGPGLAVLDLNGDGHLDIVYLLAQLPFPDPQTPSIGVVPGQGDGTFSAFQYYRGLVAQGLSVGDVNGDSRPDLIAITSTDLRIALALNLGISAGSDGLPELRGYIAGTGITAVAVGDFDGDARPDLAASNYFDLTLLPNISR